MKYANITHAKCSEAHTWLTKPKHETDGKEHSESPNEQQSKYSAANLSAHVNKTCIELPLGTLPCFTFQKRILVAVFLEVCILVVHIKYLMGS